MENLLKKLTSTILHFTIIYQGLIRHKKPRQFQIYNKINPYDEERDNKIPLEGWTARRFKEVKRSRVESEC